VIGPKRTVFAWLPMWLHDIDGQGVRVKVRRVWFCKVVQSCTFWDGWLAWADDNKEAK
jgi:hypothetical protein